jgi:hypothetical protein
MSGKLLQRLLALQQAQQTPKRERPRGRKMKRPYHGRRKNGR